MALERPKSLRELALEYLRNRIVDGTFQMGQVLSERKISEELGVNDMEVSELIDWLDCISSLEIELVSLLSLLVRHAERLSDVKPINTKCLDNFIFTIYFGSSISFKCNFNFLWNNPISIVCY